MHEILSSLLTGTVLSALAMAVPCMIADHLTGTALWSRPNAKDTDMSTDITSDRFDIFPADDDDMAALADMLAPLGDFHGLRILSDAELAELAECGDYDEVDDDDMAAYLSDVYVDIAERDDHAADYDDPQSFVPSRFY